MPFESLSIRHEIVIEDFPSEWLPLLYLYDPDLPLYPLLYFHALDPQLGAGMRPGERDRVFGFIHHVNLEGNTLRVTVAVNKDLANPANSHFGPVVEHQCRARLGLLDKITYPDLHNSLKGKLAGANALIKELWYQIVDRSFGKSLPFGQMWDPVLGLVRFIASFYSGGRKGELIQSHYFAQFFGERIATGGGIHVDFYLLPTFEEFTDQTNPLSLFPRFADLLQGADNFCKTYCTQRKIDGLTFSAFELARTKTKERQLNTKVILNLIGRQSGRINKALFENYSAFDRGPLRSIIALMMLNDLRSGYWHPSAFTAKLCAKLYRDLSGTYQTPKVIQLYAQQCFGAKAVLPIDNWIKTFLQWPLYFRESAKPKWYEEVFESCDLWGKLERLIWLAAQSRKVHSSVSAEILWCVRFGSPDQKMRGANPMACKICLDHIRTVCPAYKSTQNLTVSFNNPASPNDFNITSSAGNNTVPAQYFLRCKGRPEGHQIVDEYSPRDRPNSFLPFPTAGHNGGSMTVSDFIQKY
jgi:hypothetical protein